MPGNMDSTGLAVGLKKGFIVEKRKLAPRPASKKGVRAAAPHSRIAPRPRATKSRIRRHADSRRRQSGPQLAAHTVRHGLPPQLQEVLGG